MKKEVEILKNKLAEFEAREQRLKKFITDLVQVTSYENYQERDEETDEVTTWKLGEIYFNLTDLAICDFNEAREQMILRDLDADDILGSNLDLITTFQDFIVPILNELNYLTDEKS